MYAPFFGLSKEPFSIAPDPHFLFMSEMHREALAHLLYGVSGGGGFVLLTGEIGAGKTTVCRAFLDQVPERCAVAYIFNPKLTVIELLQTVCEEFGISVAERAGAAPSVKEHVDALNTFLLGAHAAGCHSVLIIDEAQSLAADVLEQLRLLTNLETAERKLLQIVLIGQPELRDMLARPELEQMAQRVIARYHLPALTAAQTTQYIQHRLAVAGPAARVPFDAAAMARIHALAGGVPRRINLLCDRALLGAYAHGRREVDVATVEQAAREVFGARSSVRSRADTRQAAGTRGWPLALGALAGGAVVGGLALGLGGRGASAPSAASAAASSSATSAAATPASAAVAGIAQRSATAALAATGPAASTALAGSAFASTAAGAVATSDARAVVAAALRDEAAAWRELAVRWNTTLADADPCAQAAAAGLLCFRSVEGLGLLRRLSRPAWLRLNDAGSNDAGSSPAWVQLVALSDTEATLAVGERRWRLPLAALARVWRGEFGIFWRVPPGSRDGSDSAAAPASRAWLEQQLAAAGQPAAGTPLRERVRSFQVAQALPADGVAGPLTLMLLNRLGGVDEPRLVLER